MTERTRRRLLATVGVFGTSGCLRLQEATEDGTTDGTTGDDANSSNEGGDGSDGGGSDGGSSDGDGDGDTAGDEDGGESGSEDDGENEDYPSGLSADGAMASLADAHNNSLVGSTFTSSIATRNITEGHSGSETIEVGDEAVLVTDQGGDPVEQYHDGGEILWRMRRGTRTFYGRRSGSISYDELTFTHQLRQLLWAGEWASPEPNEDGGWHVSATGTDDERTLAEEFEAASFESFEAEMDVTEDGIITTIAADFQYVTEDDRLFRVEREIGATDVGETTVDPPSWLPDARERAPRITATLLDERDCIELAHEEGDPIPQDTEVGIDGSEIEAWSKAQLQREFAADETMYAYRIDGETRIDRSGPPDGDVDPLEGDIVVWMDYHGTAFFRTRP